MKTAVIKRMVRQLEIQAFVGAVIAALLIPHPAGAQVPTMQQLRGHVPTAIKGLLPVERYAATNRLHLAIGLPLRDPDGLKTLLHEIYDPASPNYHHYLTPQEFTERFGPTEKDYQAVIAFAASNHLKITTRHPNRVLLDVEGSVADVETALHLTMRVYKHPTENRRFHAPDREPSLNFGVPVLHIGGLDDYALPQPHIQVEPANGRNAPAAVGSGPTGGFMGTDFRAAYVPDSTLDGSGQAVGLLQFDGYNSNDIAYYESNAGLASITLSNVLINGASGSPSNTGGTLEVPLDIEMSISLATNLSKVLVYIAPNTSPWEDLLNRMANDNAARQLSCSWFARGGVEDPVADQIFQQMAAQGQSFFGASGDSNAYVGLISFPEDTPYITQVGGTTLTTSGPGGSYVSETVWNKGNGTGSGGGISTQYPIPSWQTNISMFGNQGSTTMRNVPDVALTADNVYVRAETNDFTVGGTSCAAPLWASFAALVNQQAALSGRPPVGFINTAIDIIGSGQNYTSAFHDITTGNNTSLNSPNLFFAVAGYDLCTGWGTPTENLINVLANPQAVVTPALGFTSIAKPGGPFTVTSQTFSVANAGSNSLLWALANTTPWLTASPTNGTLAAGGPATTVTVSLNSAASNLSVGIYSAAVWFTNLATGTAESRQFTLNIGAPPAITSQPSDQTLLAGKTATFSVAVSSAGPCTFQWQLNGINLADNFINTVAGNGGAVFFGDGGQATNASVSQPYGVDVDSAGNVFIADEGNNRIRKVAVNGVITTVAGNGTAAYSGDGGLATNASLNGPYGVALHGSGNLFIADVGNNVIRKVDSSGTITTVAGNGSAGFSGDGGPAINANLNHPFGVDVDGSGNLFISDIFNNRIRKVATSGTITTVAGDGAAGFSGDHGAATNADLDDPFGVAVDSLGNLFIADLGNNRIRKVDTNGIITTVAGNGSAGFSGDGGVATAASLDEPYGLAVDVFGNLFVSDVLNNCVRKVDANGIITTVAGNHSAGFSGDGGPATVANLNEPYGVAVDGTDNLFIADKNNNRVRKAALAGPPTLAIPNISLNSAGSYTVIIGNEWGSVTSSVATLTVSSPPVITGQPQSLQVTNGNQAGLAVAVSGSTPFVFQWQKNQTNLTDGGNISGSAMNTLLVSATTTNDTGSYTVIITNALGSVTSGVAVLTVASPPVITSQPQSALVTNGNQASFNVAASGSTPLFYLWQKNQTNLTDGGNIAGSTTTNLVVSATTVSDSANYTVIVSNVWGSLTSSAASLTVISPPVITSQPQSLRVTNGNLAAFTVSVSGTAPFAYQWRKNQTNLTDGGNISGSATNTLLVTATTTNDTGNYDVIITNIFGTVTSSVAALTVASPPVITNQPTSLTVTNGSPASFSAAASGPAPLFYLWQKNQTNLTDGGNISGSATTNLVVSFTTINDAANYTVIVSNVWGTATSSVAVLTVLSPPAITSQPQSLRVTNGNLASLTVTASGSTPLAYQWQKNQTNLSDGGNISGSASSNLLLSLTTTNDTGNYDVIITNALGGVTSSIVLLTVASPPIITTQPTNLTVNNGNSASFSVTASGATPLVYQWQKNQTNLTDGGNILGSTNTTLFLAVAAFSDGANYTVIISNVWGTTTSAVAALTVVAPPAITSQPKSLTVNYGDPASFNVAATGTAPLAYLWLKNQTVLADGGNVSGSATNNLLLSATTSNDVASYTVIITNAFGSVTSTVASLTVVIPPILITQQPANQTASLGGTATFNVGVSSAGTLNFQWQFDGTNLPENVITTVAGNGASDYSGDGGPAISASLQDPYGVAADGSGNVFIADLGNHRVRKVDVNGVITTMAGTGTNGYSGDGGAATNATLAFPLGVAVDTFGNLFVSDELKNVVRKVDVNGIITTVAGSGGAGYSGDGGLATNATLNEPYGVAVDGSGNLYIADFGNNRIRKVSAAGTITTVAGNGTGTYSGDGGAATNASLAQPAGVAADSFGNLFIADSGNNRVRKVDTNGIITTVAGSGGVQEPYGIAVDGLGNLLVTDLRNNSIHSVATNGVVTTVAGNGSAGFSGDGNPATNAALNEPYGVAVDPAGDLFIADTVNNRIREIPLAGSATLKLTGVKLGNAGSYTIIISNPGNIVTSSVATLTIALPPAISSQPQSLTVTNGHPASFSVAASGATPLFYFWQKNETNLTDGGNISGSATTNLLLSPATTNDAASYTVIVSNVFGSLTSTVATLAVVVPPAISSQPQSLKVTNGNSASLSVAASGTAPLFYQWQKNQTNLADGGNVSGSMTTNLLLSIISTNDAGGYTVTITNAAGSVTSGIATITVASPPVITNQPKSLFVTNGALAGFSIGVSGAAPLSYQWQKNQTNLADGGNISGSMTTNLLLGLVSTNDTGNYSVIVSNVWGSLTSSVATLAVLSPPVITDQPQSLTVTNRNPASFVVTASGSAPLVYQWQKNQNNLADGQNVSGSATNELLLSPTSTNDAASYTVIVSNAVGSVTSTVASLTVFVPRIQITQQPLSQGVLLGGTVTFGVGVSSIGALSYQWQLNGANLPDDTITTVAGTGATNYSGDGGAATNASLQDPYSVAVDGSGNLFISDLANNRVRKVDANGVITTVAGNGSPGYSGDGNAATGASLFRPYGVAIDAFGNLFISDTANRRIRKVDAGGVITTVAGGGTNGNLGYGGPATNASLALPYGVGVDGFGNVFFADLESNCVRKVTADGAITTMAGINGTNGYSGDGGAATNASLNQPYGVAVDGFGNLFIADVGNNVIRKVDTNGIITTVAANGVQEPYGVAVDGFGNLVVTDLRNNAIHKVDASGVITTVAGNGMAGYSGDGGPATSASLDEPYGVAVDAAGNVFIADTVNNRIREVGLGGFPTLTLSGVTTNNTGNYTVIISNPGGSVTSSVATLTLATPPVITNQPQSLTVTNGYSASFSVAVSGSAPMAYRWLKNQINLTDGANVSGSSTSNLLLSATTTNDAGSYTVISSNSVGSATSSVAGLTVVIQQVQITQQPSNQTAVLGGTATFSVAVSGAGTPTFQWSFDGASISGATNASLVLSNVQSSQAGSYAVLATNGFNSLMSSNAVLIVAPDHFTWAQIPSPRFVNAPFPVTIQAKNAGNATLANFSGFAFLDSTNGVPVSPAGPVNFVQGVWTGTIVISQQVTGLVLRASDGSGYLGLANPINVVLPPPLDLSIAGNTLQFVWPDSYSGFVLEQSDNLVPAVWTAVPGSTPIEVGGQFIVLLQAPGTPTFYRLHFIGP